MKLELNRTETSVRLSEVAVAQVHDLPASVIDSLVLSASMNLIQRLSRHRAAVSEAWKSVEVVLTRTGMQTVEELERKLPELCEGDWEIVQLWVKRKAEMDDALERFKLIYRMGKEQADAKLARMTKIPALHRKLVLQHPQLLDDAVELQESTIDTILTYLLNSTVERTESGTTEVRFRLGDKSANVMEEVLSQVRVRQMLVDCWIHALACDDSLNEGFSFRVNDGLVHHKGKAGLLVADGIEVGGSPIINEYVYRVDHQAAGHLKKGTVRKKKDWIRSLQKAGGKMAFTDLLSKEILLPVLPEKQAEISPLKGLGVMVTKFNSPKARRLRRCFLLLEVLLNKMETCSPAALKELRKKADRAVERINGILRIHLTGRLAKGDWFTEHQSCKEKPIGLPESVLEDLVSYAKEPGVSIVRSRVTDTITSWFTEQYGRGGECSEILAFLTQCVSRLDAAEEAAIAEEDAKRAAEGTEIRKPFGPSELVPYGTLSFRVAARSEQALKRGDYQILAECLQDGIITEEEQWVRELLPNAEPLWFSYGSGWTGGENRYGGQRLLWPTDRQYAGRSGTFLTLHDLKISHDQESDTLTILGPEGTPVAPVYNGKIPVHQLPECVRLFLKLSNPWVYIKNGQSGKMRPGYAQRQTAGRVVKAPAEWRIPTKEIPLRKTGEAESDYYLRFHDWRVRKGIPREVMFSVVDAKYPTAACNGTKERYIHFGSPRLFGRFAESFSEGDLLILTEVFPERGAHAIGRSGQPCVTEFKVAVKWV
ncbi:hypothetical protein [Bhargavaea beijingensis]|uniref:Lantibiotic dehydratase, C terminus n=2 Tax=Bhargavaea beijingensis TaxID=426756 RepID=A0A1G6XHR8_9BACL|nr:hypothetical protein [Bhargavaea beijingensis]MCW1928081.1 lantibiotic dehydratase family protein [Bhargavaea beijingensis]SDD77612.1 hypothetical protein SAMN04488126_10160 [Bhargavaea beijingensis]